MSQKQNAGPPCAVIVGLVFLIVVAAAAGQLAAVTGIPEPVIVLIDIAGLITPEQLTDYQARFDYIDSHADVAGAVLLINSRGGEASVSEDLYFQTSRLRERMPVVAAVTRIGASGAYYAAMGSNYVMVKPGSFVGSVGVVYDLSIPESLTDDNFTSGPFKADGYAVAQFVRDLELVKEYFAGVVYAERSLAWDRWRDTRELFPHTQDSLATGRIWTGVAAVEVGIADGFGSVSDAIAKAAELAGLREYRVVHLNDAFMQAAGYTLSGEAAPESLEDVEQRVTEGTDFWYVYMPPAG